MVKCLYGVKMTLKEAKLVALVLTATIFLTACGNSLSEGEVYEKEFRPSKITTVMMPLVQYNPGTKTATTIIVPYTIYYPDRWVVRIRRFDGAEWKYGEWFVSESTYDTVRVGDMFEAIKDRGDKSTEPYTKTRKES